MNLGQMVDFVTQLVRKTDDNSKTICRGFIQTRYRMVWDSFPWRDTEMTALEDIDNTNVFDLPADMDRVIAIRSNGDTFLDPVSVNLLMQTDPTIFTRKGPPTCYREYNDGVNRRIQVFPTPSVSTPLFIAGKRGVVQIVQDADEPILRNITICLVTFATGDMLQRARHYDKAQLKFAEANAMLTAAQQLETNQANLPRQSKVPGQGNTLAELADQVASLTGQWSPDSMVLQKNFLRSNYQTVWDALNWTEATVCATVNNDGPEVILPEYFDRVLAIRFNPTVSSLEMAGPDVVFGVNPLIFEQSGTPGSFSYLTSVGVGILPPVQERLTIVSSSTADKGNVFVVGESLGSMVSENVVLNGTTPVQTVNKIDTPLTVSKKTTVGDVTVSGSTSGAILERILASETERRHMRIWVQPSPSTAQVCLVLGKRVINPFVQDEDTTLLRGVGATLIAGAAADMFARIGKAAESADQRTQAKEALQALVSLETQQGSFNARVLPSVEFSSDDNALYSGSGLTKSGYFY